MTLDAAEASPAQRPTSRKVVHGTCQTHPGARGFTNLLLRKVDGAIVLDPHAVGWVIELDEAEAIGLRDRLTEWLG